jgi:ATP-dependent DNA helicase RecG
MQAAVNFTDPTAQIQMRLFVCVRDDGEPDHVLIVEVPLGQSLYTTNRYKAYLIIGDESQKLSFAQRRELCFHKGQSSFESEPTRLQLGDLDQEVSRMLRSHARSVECYSLV